MLDCALLLELAMTTWKAAHGIRSSRRRSARQHVLSVSNGSAILRSESGKPRRPGPQRRPLLPPLPLRIEPRTRASRARACWPSASLPSTVGGVTAPAAAAAGHDRARPAAAGAGVAPTGAAPAPPPLPPRPPAAAVAAIAAGTATCPQCVAAAAAAAVAVVAQQQQQPTTGGWPPAAQQTKRRETARTMLRRRSLTGGARRCGSG